MSKQTRSQWTQNIEYIKVSFKIWHLDFGVQHTFRDLIHLKLPPDSKRSHANYEELFADAVKGFTVFSPEEWTYLSKMHCTSKLSTSHTSMFSSWKTNRWEAENQKFHGCFQTRCMLCVYDFTFEMKGMCILVYGFMSLISTWVLMFLRSSVTTTTWSHDGPDKTDLFRSYIHHSPSMCSRMKGSSIMLLWLVFNIFSNSVMSLFW